MEISFFCRYPFTSGAKKLVEGGGVSLTPEIAEKAMRRIMDSLSGKSRDSYSLTRPEHLEELASYGAARMMLAHMRNRYLTNKFAVAEAKRAGRHLGNEKWENIMLLGKELGVVPEEYRRGMAVRVPAYVQFCPKSPHYRLVFRNVRDGYVEVKKAEALRLMEEAVKMIVEELRPLPNPPKIIEECSAKLRKMLPKMEARKFSYREGDNPPCVEKLMEQVGAHQNLPHQARFYLATYLLARGMPMEKIVSLYSNLPDFDEKKTRYQLVHAKKRGYTVPSCPTVLSYGLCVADCRIGNPMRWKGKWKRKGSP